MINYDKFSTPNRYMHETIWLPTYVVVIIFILGFVKNSTIQTLIIIFGLILARIILEFIYRLAFGDERLTFRIAILAIIAQLIVWGSMLGWWLLTVSK